MIMDREYLEWLIKLVREDKLIKFYQSPPWRKLRLQRLQLDHYECQPCRRKGKYSKAQNVHHKKEVKKVPSLALELDNTEAICIRCHNEEHKRFGRFVKNTPKKNQDFKNFIDKESW